MKALISPMQDNFVVQVEKDENIFEVAAPLYWVDCDDSIIAYEFKYNDGFFPALPVAEETTNPTKEELLAKLLEIQAQLQGMQ